MKITQLKLKNYRNYDQIKLEFNSNLNLLIGNNAQGKTNLLESIYLLAFTKSHRTKSDQELINFNENNFNEKNAQINACVEKSTGKITLELNLGPQSKKVKINHLEQKRLADYIGQLKVVLFAPEDLRIIKGSPSLRRRFLDMEISQLSPIYLYDLMQYQAVLKQRNAFLRQLENNEKNFDQLFFQILTEQLVNFGGKVIHSRINFVEKLKIIAADFHQQIALEQEKLNLRYQSSFPLPEITSVENITDAFQNYCDKKQKNELFKKTTLYGPHRDDLEFYINDLNVANFGSQGQVRTTALATKIAEIELINHQIHEYPLLLLDDVLSELDNLRQNRLLESILNKTQTFVTTTTLDHLKELPQNLQIFHIEHGTVQ